MRIEKAVAVSLAIHLLLTCCNAIHLRISVVGTDIRVDIEML